MQDIYSIDRSVDNTIINKMLDEAENEYNKIINNKFIY